MRATPSPHPAALAPEDFARIFSQTPDSLAVEQFVSLWRRYSPVRALVAEAIKKPDPTRAMQLFAAVGIGTSAGLAGDFAAGVRARLPMARAKVTYGGLAVEKLISLLRRYKSGQHELSAYLFLCYWKRELAIRARRKEPGIDPRLVELTLEAMRRAIAADNSKFFRELAGAMETVKKAKEFTHHGRWDHNPADNEADARRFGLLLYMRAHPKPKYRIREFRRYLDDEFGLPTDAKTIRKFCVQHGIALDSRAGPPRKSERQTRERISIGSQDKG